MRKFNSSAYQFGMLLLLTILALATASDEVDDIQRFDRSTMSAYQAALESKANLHLRELELLENESPHQTKSDTLHFLKRVENTCEALKGLVPAPAGYCPYFYDQFTCWRPTPVGRWSVKACPKYVMGMHIPGVTLKIACINANENASGEPIPKWDYIYTNETHFLTLYSTCFDSITKPPPPFPDLQYILRKIQMVGPVCYSISLSALLLASLIFIMFKRLHCPRNFIHLHLFLAFMIRAVMCLVQYYLFNNGQSMPSDGEANEDTPTKFKDAGLHWECKLLVTLWNYSLVASFFWLLVEGLYLHNVVYFFVFRETGIAGYAIFGWVAPMLVIVPWIAVKVLIEDNLCWLAYLNLNYFWILRGPIMATIIINFLLFINMIRELFLKLKDSHLTETRRYRKLAKSSVLLVVILGVYYFIISIPMLVLSTDHLTWPLLICLSIEHIFGSLQGLMVALVYCFMNSEVRAVIRKRWYRWILLRQISSGTYASSAGTFGGVQGRQDSAPNTLMTTALPQLIANNDGTEDALATRIRRSLTFRRKSSALVKKFRGDMAKRASCTPANPYPTPISSNRDRCAVGGDSCANCRYADTLRQNGRIRFSELVSTAPSEKPIVMRSMDHDRSTPSPTLGSQSVCSEGKTQKGATRQNSGKTYNYQQKKLESGNTIALLRMRSPHSFDMQEMNGNTKRDEDPSMLTNEAWMIRAKPPAVGHKVNRRFSLNSSNLISYLPISYMTQKSTTSMAIKTAGPLGKNRRRQSNDEFL